MTSSDAASNSSTEPPGAQAPRSFTTPSATLTDTTVADFGAGTTGANTYVSETGNGEVTLSADRGRGVLGRARAAIRLAEPALEPAPAGSATVVGRKARGRRRRAGTVATYGPGARSSSWRRSAARASSTSASASTSTTPPLGDVQHQGRRHRSTPAPTTVASQTETQLPSAAWSAARTATGSSGTRPRSATSSTATWSRPMRSPSVPPRCGPWPATSTAAAPDVSVDWLHLSPYAASRAPSTRASSTPASRSTGAPLAGPPTRPRGTGVAHQRADRQHPDARRELERLHPDRLRRRDRSCRQLPLPPIPRPAELRATRTSTPSLSDVSVGYTAGADTTAPTIVQRSPRPGRHRRRRRRERPVQFSEPMDPSTIDSSSFRLRAQGAGSDVPAAVSYSGATATLNPNADLAPGTVYHVTVAGVGRGRQRQRARRRRHLELHDPSRLPHRHHHRRLQLRDHRRRHLRLRNRQRRGHPEADRGRGVLGRAALPSGWSGQTWESQGGGAGGSATLAGGGPARQRRLRQHRPDLRPGPRARVRGDLRRRHLPARRPLATTSKARSRSSAPRTARLRSSRAATSAAAQTDTPVGALVGTPHRYRIEWDANQVRYYVDGNLVATHSGTFSTALRRGRQRLQRRRPRALRRLDADEPLSGLGHLRLAGPRRGPVRQLGRSLVDRRHARRHGRRAQRPDRQHPDPRRELERLQPGRLLRRIDRRQLSLPPIPRPAELERPGQDTDPERRDGELRGDYDRPRHPDRLRALGTTSNPSPTFAFSADRSPAPPSSVASTPPAPATGPPASRRSPTPTSPTAPTPSRCGPPTAPGTPTRPRPRARSRCDGRDPHLGLDPVGQGGTRARRTTSRSPDPPPRCCG